MIQAMKFVVEELQVLGLRVLTPRFKYDWDERNYIGNEIISCANKILLMIQESGDED